MGVLPLLNYYNVSPGVDKWVVLYDYVNSTNDCPNLDAKTTITIIYFEYLSSYIDAMKPFAVIYSLRYFPYPYMNDTPDKTYRMMALRIPTEVYQVNLDPLPNCKLSFPSIDESPYEALAYSASWLNIISYLLIIVNITLALISLWLMYKVTELQFRRPSYTIIFVLLVIEIIAAILRILRYSQIDANSQILEYMIVFLGISLLITNKFTILSIWYDSLQTIGAAMKMQMRTPFLITSKAFVVGIILFTFSIEVTICIIYLGQYLMIFSASLYGVINTILSIFIVLGILISIFSFKVSFYFFVNSLFIN